MSEPDPFTDFIEEQLNINLLVLNYVNTDNKIEALPLLLQNVEMLKGLKDGWQEQRGGGRLMDDTTLALIIVIFMLAFLVLLLFAALLTRSKRKYIQAGWIYPFCSHDWEAQGDMLKETFPPTFKCRKCGKEEGL